MSCEDDDHYSIPDDVFFEYYFYNTAWTDFIDGFIIDKNGTIKTYYEKVKGNTTKLNWNFPENNFITSEELMKNLEKATAIELKISNEEMAKYVQRGQFHRRK
jgi:hypothetical protein